MTTLQAIADRVTTATAISGRQSVDPLTVLLFVQAIAGALQACYANPVEAADYVSMRDIPVHPFRRIRRRRVLENMIAKKCRASGIALVRVPEIRDAVFAECKRATADVVADLFADIRAKGNA